MFLRIPQEHIIQKIKRLATHYNVSCLKYAYAFLFFSVVILTWWQAQQNYTHSSIIDHIVD